MIIYPAAFILSEAAASRPLTRPRIGWQTYTFDLAPSAITASTETADGPKDAPLRPDTAEYWEPSALPATWEIDLGATRTVDYVGIAGHTIGSSGAAATVTTGMSSPAATALATGVSPADDSPLLFLDSSRSARYVRVALTGGAVMPKLAVIYIGVALAMEREIEAPYTPLNLSRQTVLHRSLSKGGQFLGQGMRRNGLTGQAKFQYLSPDFYRDEFDLFVKHARSLPYFFGWCPAEYPKEIAFAWSLADIAPSYMGIKDVDGVNWMSVQWNMQGIGAE